MGNKRKFLYFDDVMMNECNLECTYCRDKIIPLEKTKTNSLLNGFKKGLTNVDDFADYSILKLSGYGEFTLLPGWYEFILEIKEKKKDISIQLITNGTILDKSIIKKLSKLSNFTICLSLDGHTMLMNSIRFNQENTLNKILENLSILVKYGIPIEINSVLTKFNTKDFHEFLDYLLTLHGNIMNLPFPVRDFEGIENSSNFPKTEDVKKFETSVINNYEHYSDILPSKKYLERLLLFMDTRRKNWRCYTAYMNVGVDELGLLKSCACGVKENLGNIFIDSKSAFLKKENITPDTKWSECNNCFTHYEIINLYFDDSLPLSAMSKIPSLNNPKVLQRLKEIKEGI